MKKAMLLVLLSFMFVNTVDLLGQEHHTVRLRTSTYGSPPKGEIMAFSPDGSELAIGTSSKTFFIRTMDGELTSAHPAAAFSLTYSKNGSRIHLISERFNRQWLDAYSKQDLKIVPVREPGFVGLGLENKNGKLLIARINPGGPVDQNGAIKIGDELIGIGPGASGEIYSMIGQSAKRATSYLQGEAGTTVRVQVIPKGEIEDVQHFLVRRGRRATAEGYAFTEPDKQDLDDRVARCIAGGNHEFSHAMSGRVVSAFRMHNIRNNVGEGGLSKDGRLFAFAGAYIQPPQELLAKSKKTSRSDNTGSGITSALYESAWKEVASGDTDPDYGVEIFDVATGRLVSTFPIYVGSRRVHSTAFSPDNKKLVIANFYGATIYDVETGEKLDTFDSGLPSRQGVVSVDMSDDLLAIGDTEGGVSLIDINSGELLRRIPSRENNYVELTRFSPDGKRLAFYCEGILHLVEVER